MGAPLLQGSPVHCVLYADDLLLMALSARGLHCQAAVLEAYAARWGLTVNASKTKVLVFRHRPGSAAGEGHQDPHWGPDRGGGGWVHIPGGGDASWGWVFE